MRVSPHYAVAPPQPNFVAPPHKKGPAARAIPLAQRPSERRIPTVANFTIRERFRVQAGLLTPPTHAWIIL